MIVSTTQPSRGWGNFQATLAVIFCLSTASAVIVESSPVDVGKRYVDHHDLAAGTGEEHHIHKRAAVTLPDNVTFSLTKTGEHENETDIRLGTRVSFRLYILFPQTTTDMLVELFAPDNESIVMMLCDVTINKIGSNLQKTGAAQIVMDSQNSSTKYYDRAIIDFGNVTNDFNVNQNVEDESAIIITWDAVMIQNDATVSGNEYWVSAGAEYNAENEVWVGQASFTADLDTEPTTFPSPVLNLTGPTTMAIGQSAVFQLDIYLTEPSAGLSIDAFAPLNGTDAMSICGMKVVDAGTNYACTFKPEDYTAEAFLDSNTRGYGRYRLDLGTVTNKGARDASNPMENNRITVQFVVHLYEDESVITNCYWVGAAVEIGSTHIWAGEIKVTAMAYAPSAPNISPTWTVTKGGSGKVSAVAPLQMTLDLDLPQGTWSKYALEILAPFNDSAAVLQLCAVRLVSAGENLPCTDLEAPLPIYSTRGDDPQYTDRAYIDLGVLTNVGPWGWQPNDTSTADTVRFEFMLKATSHPLAVVGSQHAVTLGLVIGDLRLMIGSYSVEIEASTDLPNITAEMTPEWNLTWKAGDGNVAIGGSGQFLLSISTKRNTVYSPFDVEALMPNSTGATQVTVCRMKVESVGRNLPCLIPSAINDSVTYTSMLDDGLNDRAVVNVASLCNFEAVNDTAEDLLVLKVGFQLQPDAGLTNNENNWLSMGVQFSQYRMWVGQIQFTARTDLSIPSTPPHVSVIGDAASSVAIGYVAKYQLLIKTHPNTIAPYTINVSVSDLGLSVCSVKILYVGDNMPCTNASTIEGLYESDSTRANIKGSLDLGIVSNAGEDTVVADDNVDENTIVVEIAIGLTTDTTVIPNWTDRGFDVQVNHDGTAINPSVPTFKVTHYTGGITTVSMNVSHVELNVVPVTTSDPTDNSTNVVLGQAKQLEMCVWTYPGSLSKLALKMMTPAGVTDVLEVNYIGLSRAGKNVPCAGSCKTGVVTYEPRVGSQTTDIATIDFGYLYNNNFDTVDTDANKVCVRSVVRVLRNETLVPGSTVTATAAVNSNDIEIVVIEESLTVVDNSTFVDNYQDNATLVNNTIVKVNSSLTSPLCLYPGDVQVFPLLLTIPPQTTSVVEMDIKLELNQSACFTFQEMRLVGVGKNLRGFGKDYDLECYPNSTMGTTQMDTVDCKLGVVTNPGLSHICEDATEDDDSIYAEVTLQMADCVIAEKDAILTVSFGLKVAGYLAIVNFPIQVCRFGNEEPTYNISAVANSTGDTMYLNYDIRLDNASRAEIHNSSLTVIPPPYVECPTLVSNTGANQVPVLTANANDVVVQLGSVYLTDAIDLVLLCNSKSGYTVPDSINGFYTVVKHQLYGEIYERTGSTLPSTEIWSYMSFVNFTATTVSSTGACSSASLGLDNSATIFDCQISSSAGSLNDAATDGRKGGVGWTPFVREGELQGYRYFQVYFPNKVLVDRVEVEQKDATRAMQLRMAYSNDGKTFVDGETINLLGNVLEQKQLASPSAAQIVRIYVTNQNPPGKNLKLTFDLFGCVVSTGGPTTQAAVCAAAAAMVPAPSLDVLFYQRSFVSSTSGRVFVCDGVVKQNGIVSRCFTSADGTDWQPMDDRVASMVGHESEANRVYAMHSDGVTFMSSDDDGRTWANTHSDYINTAKGKSTFVQAMSVPWVDDASLPPGDPLTPNRVGAWGASYDYLKNQNGASWDPKLKWNCC